MAEAQLGGIAEGTDGAGAGGPSKGHLPDHPGRADDDHKNEVRDEKGGPAVLGDTAGKSQMLPIPTAEPMQARMNPHLDPQESRTALCFSMERRPFSKNTAGTRENRQGPCGPCRVTFF